MEASQIERINELARIAKERDLTPEETAERASLRAAYLAGFRENFKNTLEHTKIEYPDGTRVPLRGPNTPSPKE